MFHTYICEIMAPKFTVEEYVRFSTISTSLNSVWLVIVRFFPGIQSWGIAWWINGLLIPEITVQRGTNYTFVVEGGDNPSNSASYHPLYITNNPEGGGAHHLDHIGLPVNSQSFKFIKCI